MLWESGTVHKLDEESRLEICKKYKHTAMVDNNTGTN